MMTLNPYLTFNGNCEEAFGFYKKVFKKEFAHISKFKDMPPSKEFPVAEADKEKIMHVSIQFDHGLSLMGSDASDTFGGGFKEGNNVTVSINVDKPEEAKRMYTELSDQGRIIVPYDKTFWGAYYGLFFDRFGIQWMVNCELEEHKDFEKKANK
ncbi:MAG: VOC family protein [Flavobacteriales bacterium]|nr:VOC family protein [Flavobacteriales bacterium]